MPNTDDTTITARFKKSVVHNKNRLLTADNFSLDELIKRLSQAGLKEHSLYKKVKYSSPTDVMVDYFDINNNIDGVLSGFLIKEEEPSDLSIELEFFNFDNKFPVYMHPEYTSDELIDEVRCTIKYQGTLNMALKIIPLKECIIDYLKELDPRIE